MRKRTFLTWLSSATILSLTLSMAATRALAAQATPRAGVHMGSTGVEWRGDRAGIGVNAAFNQKVQGKHGRHGAQVQNQVQREGTLLGGAASDTQSPLIAAGTQKQALASSSTIGGAWSSLGPNPINFNGKAGFPTAAGRVLSFAYGATSQTLYLGSAGGGVWKSVAGGAWQPLTDNMPSLAIGSLAVDSANNNLVFAGSGEQINYAPCAGPGTCGPHLYGLGLYKSTDGGTTWANTGANVFYRQAISAIRIDPTNHNRIFASVVNEGSNGTRGVAVSTDGGSTWTEPSGALTLGAFDVNDLVIDNNGNLYAAVQGQGVYYSSNHGLSWTLDNGTGVNSLPGPAGDVYKIALAPNTASNAQGSQLVYAIASDPSTEEVLGVYRSADGGADWTQIGDNTSVVSNNQGFYDLYVAVDPSDSTGNTVYIGAVDVAKTTNAGSPAPTWGNITNVYGGTCQASPGAIHPDQHGIIFVNDTVYFGNDGGVYKTSSTASGVTGCQNQIVDGGFENGEPSTPWVESSGNGSPLVDTNSPHTGFYSADLCGYSSCLDSIAQSFTVPSSYSALTLSFTMGIVSGKAACTGTGADQILAEMLDPHGTVIGSLTIPGSNCSPLNTWLTGSEDMSSALASFKGQSVTLKFVGTTDSSAATSEYFIDDVVVNAIAGASLPFTDFNSNLAISQFYDGVLGTGANAGSWVLGGLQDNGTVQTQGSGLKEVNVGDRFFTAVDASNNLKEYGEYYGGNTYATTDNWSTVTQTADPSWGGTGEPANFAAPLVMDPNTPTTLYSAHLSLWKTTNSEGNWTSIGGAFASGNNMSAVGVSKSAPNTLYAADYAGESEVTTNGGTTWSGLPAFAPAGAGITDLAVDPTNSQIVYATVNSFDGAQRGHVFRSSNGGANWTDISTSLPDIPFQTVAVNPTTPTTIYAGSDNGAYVSTNSGASWSVLGTGLPNVQVYKLVPSADGTQVTAFTFGRGAWRVSMTATGPITSFAPGWNLVDVPLAGTGLTTLSSLSQSLTTSLGAGVVRMLATYTRGRYALYLQGYSADSAVGGSSGIFVLTAASGSWTASGQAYTSSNEPGVSLQAGWNLVAAPYPPSGLSASRVNTEIGTACGLQAIAVYGSGGYTVWTPTSTQDVPIPATSGFWIECTTAASWTPS